MLKIVLTVFEILIFQKIAVCQIAIIQLSDQPIILKENLVLALQTEFSVKKPITEIYAACVVYGNTLTETTAQFKPVVINRGVEKVVNVSPTEQIVREVWVRNILISSAAFTIPIDNYEVFIRCDMNVSVNKLGFDAITQNVSTQSVKLQNEVDYGSSSSGNGSSTASNQTDCRTLKSENKKNITYTCPFGNNSHWLRSVSEDGVEVSVTTLSANPSQPFDAIQVNSDKLTLQLEDCSKVIGQFWCRNNQGDTGANNTMTMGTDPQYIEEHVEQLSIEMSLVGASSKVEVIAPQFSYIQLESAQSCVVKCEMSYDIYPRWTWSWELHDKSGNLLNNSSKNGELVSYSMGRVLGMEDDEDYMDSQFFLNQVSPSLSLKELRCIAKNEYVTVSRSAVLMVKETEWVLPTMLILVIMACFTIYHSIYLISSDIVRKRKQNRFNRQKRYDNSHFN